LAAALLVTVAAGAAQAQENEDVGGILPTSHWSHRASGLIETLRFNSEGGVALDSTVLYSESNDTGTFTIDGSTLRISYHKTGRESLLFGPSLDPRYLWQLIQSPGGKDEPAIYVSDDLVREPGTAANVDGVDLIVMGGEMERCTANLNVRQAPAAAARKATIYDGTSRQLPSLPAGTIVRTLARTSSKDTVSGTTAYWYLVPLEDGLTNIPDKSGAVPATGTFGYALWDSVHDARVGWVFGGFLETGDFQMKYE
jgi:hypothetical protein